MEEPATKQQPENGGADPSAAVALPGSEGGEGPRPSVTPAGPRPWWDRSGDLDLEDMLLSVMVVSLVLFSWDEPVARRVTALPPAFQWMLLLLVYAGFFVCVATRVRASSAPDGAPPLRRRPLLLLMYLTPLLGYPVLSYLLRENDQGEQFLIPILLVFFLAAFAASFRSRARALAIGTRRLLLLPLTVFNTWYCTELLIDRYVYEPPALKRAALAVVEGRWVDVMLQGLEVALATGVFFLVPYLFLIVFPRTVSGELSSLRAWYRRFALFVAGIVVGFGIEASQMVDKALFEAHHHFDSMKMALQYPGEVIVLDLRMEPNLTLEERASSDRLPPAIVSLKELEVLYTPPGLERLPPEIGDLSSLRSLFLTGSLHRELPEQLGRLTRLEILDAHENQLEALPEGLGSLSRLKRLNLRANRFTSVPPVVARLTGLEVLDLARNPLEREAVLSGVALVEGLPSLKQVVMPFSLTDEERTEIERRFAARGVELRFGD